MSKTPPRQPIERLFDLLPYVAARYGQRTAFGSRKDGGWVELSYSAYAEQATCLSSALLNMGVAKGDKIISLLPNCGEFNVVDMGILQTGAIHVPLYPGVSDQKIMDIMRETGARIVFTHSGKQERFLLAQVSALSPDVHLVSLDGTMGCTAFANLLHRGGQNQQIARLEEAKNNITADDTACIIYISGANTPLLGVELTHGNQVFNMVAYASDPHTHGITSALSLLPLAHSYERIINYCEQYMGISVWYNDKPSSLVRNAREQKPDMMVMVPLLLERLITGFEKKTLASKIFGEKARKICQSARKTSPVEPLPVAKKWGYGAAYKIVFRAWKKALGGNLKLVLCGGAALDQEIYNLAWHAEIPVYEGYGITEAGPLVTYNRVKKTAHHTVGKAVQGVQIRLADDGEVLVKSSGVMKGYYGNPDATRLVIGASGWLHTGDLGAMDKAGNLTLTGVKKQIYKLSSGLYVSPAAVQKDLMKTGAFDQVFVFGHNKPYLVALVLPKAGGMDAPKSTIGEQKTTEELLRRIHQQVEAEIHQYNQQQKKPEQIVKFALADRPWAVDSGSGKPENEQGLVQQLLGLYTAP